jgi:hypothetical protein
LAQQNTNQKKSLRDRILKGPYFWIFLALLVLLPMIYVSTSGESNRVDTNVGMQLLHDDKVDEAKIFDGDQKVELSLKDDYNDDGRDLGKSVVFYYVQPRAGDVVQAMDDAGLQGYTDQPVQNNWFTSLLGFLLPFLIILVLFWFLLSRMSGGGSQIMSFGKSKAKKFNKENSTVKFSDVAGSDEAVEELQEVKEFLTDPSRFTSVGAKIPKGVLLYGPPGTGKTLLAKAVAGEAGVPFFSISGSDFVEMFVGVGASRVRDLFEQAKQNEAAIIFVDEIDAVGRQRGAGMGGGQRRARADPEPAPGGDGRVRREHQHHPHRRHQPAGRAGPRAAAPGPLRPPDRRRRPGPEGPQADPRGARRGQAAGDQRGPGPGGQEDPGLHRRGPGQRDERGGAAHRALQRPDHRRPRAGRGDRPRDRRPRSGAPGS